MLQKCDIHTVVTGDSFRSIYADIRDQQEIQIDNLLLIRTKGPLLDYEQDFTALLKKQPATLNCTTPLCNTDTVEILFTSGTTSLPKGVVITHHNLVFAGYYTAWQAALVHDDIYMTVLPAYQTVEKVRSGLLFASQSHGTKRFGENVVSPNPRKFYFLCS